MTEQVEINNEGDIIKEKETKLIGKLFQKKKEEPKSNNPQTEEMEKPETKEEVTFEQLVSIVYSGLTFEQLVSLANKKHLEVLEENKLLSDKLKTIILNIN